MTSSSAEKPGANSCVSRDRPADELLDEVDAHAAGQEEEQGVRLDAADLRQFGGVVELAELGVDLFRDVALVETTEAGNGVLAARVVRGDDHDILVALVLHHLADGFVQVVVLPGDVEEEGVALLAGVLRRAGIGRNVESLVLEDGRADGEHDVGEDDAGHEIDLVLLQELVGRLLGDVRILLVVGDQHFGRQVTQLAVQVLHAKLKTVADIDA